MKKRVLALLLALLPMAVPAAEAVELPVEAPAALLMEKETGQGLDGGGLGAAVVHEDDGAPRGADTLERNARYSSFLENPDAFAAALQASAARMPASTCRRTCSSTSSKVSAGASSRAAPSSTSTYSPLGAFSL